MSSQSRGDTSCCVGKSDVDMFILQVPRVQRRQHQATAQPHQNDIIILAAAAVCGQLLAMRVVCRNCRQAQVSKLIITAKKSRPALILVVGDSLTVSSTTSKLVMLIMRLISLMHSTFNASQPSCSCFLPALCPPSHLAVYSASTHTKRLAPSRCVTNFVFCTIQLATFNCRRWSLKAFVALCAAFLLLNHYSSCLRPVLCSFLKLVFML